MVEKAFLLPMPLHQKTSSGLMEESASLDNEAQDIFNAKKKHLFPDAQRKLINACFMRIIALRKSE